ncbi:hypothetical protein E3P91_03786 [Wallemia ichthyophaga]|nr:hypothetical protein E3P91_03786 [Wallemia ichthyophaga]
MAESFAKFDHLLDKRLLRSLADMGFATPTLIQAKAVPIGVDGKDILARAKTGSGKTLAYLLPIVQNLLRDKDKESEDVHKPACRALILVPTRELSEQISSHLKSLVKYSSNEISHVNLAGSGTDNKFQRLLLSDKPDIVISTPSRLIGHLQSKAITLDSLKCLTIDEADLILSYGHADDVKALLKGGYLPKIYQSFLMSATMTSDVDKLRGMVLRNPAILTLRDDEDGSSNLKQYYVKCPENDKYLLTYVILKLKLIKGKVIMFVNSVERGFKLRLFLEAFGIRAVVLNRELPINSRFHIVQEFNKGVYDYMIATDEAGAFDQQEEDDEESDESEDDENSSSDEDDDVDKEIDAVLSSADEEDAAVAIPSAAAPKKRKREKGKEKEDSKDTKESKKAKTTKKGEKEFGVSRGIDFVDVACVVNFDLPKNMSSYVHRVGRTARAGRTGISLSFVVDNEKKSKRNEEKFWKRIAKRQESKGGVHNWDFDWKQVEGFKYRVSDALRMVTPHAVREARVKELKNEILNNDKLKAHFEDNPNDYEFLKHDKPLHPMRQQPHLKHVPGYLMPRIAGVKQPTTPNLNPDKIGFNKRNKNKQKKKDPLKKFSRK